MEEQILRIRHLSKSFGKQEVLKDIESYCDIEPQST